MAVGLPRSDAGDEAVPDVAVALGENQPRLAAIGVEQAEGHLVTG